MSGVVPVDEFVSCELEHPGEQEELGAVERDRVERVDERPAVTGDRIAVGTVASRGRCGVEPAEGDEEDNGSEDDGPADADEDGRPRDDEEEGADDGRRQSVAEPRGAPPHPEDLPARALGHVRGDERVARRVDERRAQSRSEGGGREREEGRRESGD